MLAEPGDPESLSGCVARVVRGEVSWSGLRRQALARHAAHFSDRVMAERVAAVYDQVLARRP